jgi:hypothetical protein
MADKSQPESSKGKEVEFRLSPCFKINLTFSAEAAKKHRDNNKNEKALRMFEEAIEKRAKEDNLSRL